MGDQRGGKIGKGGRGGWRQKRWSLRLGFETGADQVPHPPGACWAGPVESFFFLFSVFFLSAFSFFLRFLKNQFNLIFFGNKKFQNLKLLKI
jgi:hypothetical protein